ncbi:hypothetical protein [Actinosynnema sp. NPDC020468]|uniref:nSTAND1 domain-containing NTPase n=1 Tax=Actinosynnema sp. NPDC020468 TaxID=3154488 RepID=UPI00340C6918
MDDGGQSATHALLLRLVKIGESTDHTRRTVAIADLACDTALLDAFTDARLLTRERDSVTITHEALIRAWPRMRDWIEEDRASNLLRQKLEEAALAWDLDDRDPALLWRGNRIGTARALMPRGKAESTLNDRERDFLEACLRVEHEEQAARRRSTRRLNQLVAALSALVLVLASTVAIVVVAGQRADEARIRAAAQEAALRTGVLLKDDPVTAVELAHAAHRVAPTPATRDALLSAFAAFGRLQLNGVGPQFGTGQYFAVADNGEVMINNFEDDVELWHPEADRLVPDARFRPAPGSSNLKFVNGSVAIFSSWSTTEVWNISDLAAPRLRATLPLNMEMGGVSADGGVVVGYDGGTVPPEEDYTPIVAWDLSGSAGPRRIAVPCDHGFADVHPGGRLLAIACQQGDHVSSVGLWSVTEAATLKPVATISFGESARYQIGFSDEGGFLLGVAPENGRARVWDVRDPERPRPWGEVAFRGRPSSFSFTDDDHVLILPDNRNEVQFWRVDSAAPPELLNSIKPGFVMADPVVRRPRFDDYVVAVGHEVRRIDLDVDRVITRICAEPSLRLTGDEWREYLPGVDERPVCP